MRHAEDFLIISAFGFDQFGSDSIFSSFFSALCTANHKHSLRSKVFTVRAYKWGDWSVLTERLNLCEWIRLRTFVGGVHSNNILSELCARLAQFARRQFAVIWAFEVTTRTASIELSISARKKKKLPSHNTKSRTIKAPGVEWDKTCARHYRNPLISQSNATTKSVQACEEGRLRKKNRSQFLKLKQSSCGSRKIEEIN